MKLQHIHIGLITGPRLNPRKRKDPQKVAELMDSIREHGVITPISVREVPGGYEVVMGDRRYTATNNLLKVLSADADALRGRSPEIAAELDELREQRSVMPCAILEGAELLDCEEKQLVENLQREEMATIDQSRGFAWLVQARGYSIQQLAQKLGCSRSYVADRLKLLDAPARMLAALESGDIPLKVALEVARIPAAEDRERCAEEVLNPRHYEEPLSLQMTRQWIQQHYVVNLRSPGFDPEDATLVPAAGKCSVCPYRATNMPEIEIAGGRAGRRGVDPFACFSPACFRAKSEAAWERVRSAAETDGRTVLDSATSARVFAGSGGGVSFDAPYVDLDGRPGPEWTGHYDGGKVGRWRDLLAGHEVPIVLARHPETRKIHELARRDLVIAALRDSKAAASDLLKRSPKLAKAEHSEAQREARAATRSRTTAAVARVARVISGLSALRSIERDLMLEMTIAAYATHYDAAQLVKRALRLGEDGEAFRRHAEKVPTIEGLFALLATLVVSDDLRSSGESVLFETLERFAGAEV